MQLVDPNSVMVYPHSQIQTEQHPQTRCSTCQTVFEVSPELLSSTDTRVRCGECLSIFDAAEGLCGSSRGLSDHAGESVMADAIYPPRDDDAARDAKAAALAGLANDTAALDVTYSDFDLFSENADLPEIAYFDQTRDTPDFDFDAVELDEDETFNDTLFAHDVTINADSENKNANSVKSVDAVLTDVDFISATTPLMPLVFNYRDRDDQDENDQDVLARESRSHETSMGGGDPAVAPVIVLPEEKKRGSWLARSLMTGTLCILLGGLYIYRERNSLYNHPIARPVMQASCVIFRCSVPSRVDLASLKLPKRTAYSHPNKPNALVLDFTIRNDAAFAQRFPLLLIKLTDHTGHSVARRTFRPAEYLDEWQQTDTIAAGKRIDITLEVGDPGSRATGFEMKFGES